MPVGAPRCAVRPGVPPRRAWRRGAARCRRCGLGAAAASGLVAAALTLAIVGGLGRIGGDLGVARARRRELEASVWTPTATETQRRGSPSIKPGNATRGEGGRVTPGPAALVTQRGPNAAASVRSASGTVTAAAAATDTERWLRALGALAAAAQYDDERRQDAHDGRAFRVCIATTTAADEVQAAREILPWAAYHRAIGASDIMVFLDESTPADTRGTRRLLSQAHRLGALTLLMAEEASARLGNQALMNKQGKNIRRALEIAGARAADAAQHTCDWLAHIDVDELLLPLPRGARGGGAVATMPALRSSEAGKLPLPFSLHATLAEAYERREVVQVHVWNHEAKPETSDVSRRFEEVTLFSTNDMFRINPDPHNLGLTPEGLAWRNDSANAAALEAATHGRHSFNLYYNGKPIGKVGQRLQENGPHYFRTYGKLEDGRRTTWDAPDMALLHYPYALPEEVEEKAMRSCAASPDESLGDAAGRCFIYVLEQKMWKAVNAARSRAERRRAALDFHASRIVYHHADDDAPPASPENGTAGSDGRLRWSMRENYEVELGRGRLARLREPQTLMGWLRTLGNTHGDERGSTLAPVRCAARLLAALRGGEGHRPSGEQAFLTARSSLLAGCVGAA